MFRFGPFPLDLPSTVSTLELPVASGGHSSIKIPSMVVSPAPTEYLRKVLETILAFTESLQLSALVLIALHTLYLKQSQLLIPPSNYGFFLALLLVSTDMLLHRC